MVKNASGLYSTVFQDGGDQNIALTNGESTMKKNVEEVWLSCLKAMTTNVPRVWCRGV